MWCDSPFVSPLLSLLSRAPLPAQRSQSVCGCLARSSLRKRRFFILVCSRCTEERSCLVLCNKQKFNLSQQVNYFIHFFELSSPHHYRHLHHYQYHQHLRLQLDFGFDFSSSPCLFYKDCLLPSIISLLQKSTTTSSSSPVLLFC